MKEAQFWLPQGTLVGGRYELDTVLGVGGYGITYKGRDVRLDRIVAVKEYYPGFWCSRYAENDLNVHCQGQALEEYEKGMERFLDEAKTLVSLSDVSEVVRVSDFFEQNNTAYLVMDYLDGQNLKQMANGFGGRIPADILIPVLEPLVRALGKIHEKGMIHRDLSPDNIMMLEDGTTRLIDFGNARDTSNNKSITLAMKQGFAAPEQYKSRGQGTFTDVYGICATMYYCLTGKLPPQAMERLTGTPFLTPTELGVDINLAWETAIMDGLELYVQKRIQTMEELWERLYGVNSVCEEEVEKACQRARTTPLYGMNDDEKSQYYVTGHDDYGKEKDYLQTEPLHQESRHLQRQAYRYVESGENQNRKYKDKHTEEKSENKLQSGLEIIRNACIQIYQMLKEK